MDEKEHRRYKQKCKEQERWTVLFQLLAWANGCHPWVGVSSAHIL